MAEKTTNKTKLIFFITATIILLFTSQCSFLFSINNSIDANVFILAGKLILNGKHAYTDFFEHKGIIVHLFHALALMICPDSFHGIYLFEIITAYCFYLYSYKTIKLLNADVTDLKAIIMTLIACSTTYFSNTMTYGDQVEEFILPMIIYFLYQIAKYIKNHEINKKAYIFTGIMIGIIFWAKYLCVLTHFILFIALTIIMWIKKDRKQILNIIIYLSIGFIITTIPVTIYLLTTHSFKKMTEIYFYLNIFVYDRRNLTSPIIEAIQSFIEKNSFIMPIYIGCMMTTLLSTKNNLIAKTTIIAHTITIIVITLCNGWQYYYLPTYAFLPIEIIYLKNMLKPKTQKILAITAIAMFITMYFQTMNFHIPNLKHSKQKEIANIINQSDNPSLLVLYNGDDGYYLTTGLIPDEYYFVMENLERDKITERYNEILANHEKQFLLTKHIGNETRTEIDWSKKINTEIRDLLNSYGYKLIYTCDDAGRDDYSHIYSMVALYELEQ